MADVTLTASMRANLYSLQQTAQLMGTVQNRLSTGKKVNSALDNPNNYFTAQSLSNRATDISSLLDGMGQAIQTIKAATQGIEAAQKLIDQMKAVANSALQTANSTASGARTEVEATGSVDTSKLITEDDNTQLLTNLKNNSTGLSLGIVVGDTLTTQEGAAGSTFTFTVTETSTVKDLTDFLEGRNAGVAISSGVVTITNNATSSLTIAGNVATAMDIGATSLTATSSDTASAITVATGATQLATLATAGTANDTIALTALTDVNGESLGIALGDKLTIKLGDNGQEVSFVVGGTNANNTTVNATGGGATLKDLQDWLEAQGDGTGDFQLTVSGGKLQIYNVATAALGLTVSGKLAEALDVDGTAAATSGYLESSAKLYSTLQNAPEKVTSTTLLRDLTSNNGTFIANGQAQVGDDLTIETAAGTTKITFTEGMTVGHLLSQLNAIDDDLTFSLNSNGQFVIDNQTSGNVTFTGDAYALFVDPSDANSVFGTNTAGNAQTSTRVMYAGYEPSSSGASGTGVIDATKSAQFDTLRTQLDELVADASYQGTNLISGASNSPLTVTFNEAATGASKLVINAVDLTTTGLGVKLAAGTETGSWQNADAVRDTLSTLTSAATTLRNQAATFGYNLSTVQNRQDFATNMISTLKEGADKLTLADMNEEGANMLALQTRSQLGTQSLSLASQANQSVMRLFG